MIYTVDSGFCQRVSEEEKAKEKTKLDISIISDRNENSLCCELIVYCEIRKTTARR